jgi:TPP-dependent pyruvate/acetoin dehydrogenase alpha subunit
VLLGEGILTREDADAVRVRAEEAVAAAAAFAEQSPEVPESELARHLYAHPWTDDPRGGAAMPGEPA